MLWRGNQTWWREAMHADERRLSRLTTPFGLGDAMKAGEAATVKLFFLHAVSVKKGRIVKYHDRGRKKTAKIAAQIHAVGANLHVILPSNTKLLGLGKVKLRTDETRQDMCCENDPLIKPRPRSIAPSVRALKAFSSLALNSLPTNGAFVKGRPPTDRANLSALLIYYLRALSVIVTISMMTFYFA